MREACSNCMLVPETAKPSGDGSPVSADDLTAAMGEERPRDAFRLTPAELCADRGVADRDLPASSQQRPNHARSITDVEHDSAQRSRPVMDCCHVRGIE